MTARSTSTHPCQQIELIPTFPLETSSHINATYTEEPFSCTAARRLAELRKVGSAKAGLSSSLWDILCSWKCKCRSHVANMIQCNLLNHSRFGINRQASNHRKCLVFISLIKVSEESNQDGGRLDEALLIWSRLNLFRGNRNGSNYLKNVFSVWLCVMFGFKTSSAFSCSSVQKSSVTLHFFFCFQVVWIFWSTLLKRFWPTILKALWRIFKFLERIQWRSKI